MRNKRVWLIAFFSICVILTGCGKTRAVVQTTTDESTTESNKIENSEIESNATEVNVNENNETESNENQNDVIESDTANNQTHAQETGNQSNSQSSQNQTGGQSGGGGSTAGGSSGDSGSTTGSSSDDTWVAVTGEVIASGIGKDTMMLWGNTFRKFSDGTYYCDNGEWARTQGPVAENLDEFYSILEEAVKTGNNNFTIYINVFEESFGRGVEDTFELIEHKGTTYYARNRILSSTYEMADFEKISKKTGKNVYWDLNYYYFVMTECKYAPVDVSLFYTTEKMYIFEDREGFDKAVDIAYRDGVKNAMFILKWDQKDEVFSWQEWSDTYAAGPYMGYSGSHGREYSYFYPQRVIAAEGPETGAFALSKQPAYETFVRRKSMDGVYTCMNERMDDGSIEKRDYTCCFLFEVEIVNWHDEIDKYQIPFCNNNDELMAQVKKYTGNRENELGYVGYAKCEYEDAYQYYLNAMEYVPGNRVLYYMIAHGYWILVKEY